MSTEAAEVQSQTASKSKKTEYEKVTMTDNRVVEFPKSRSLQKQSFIPGEDGYTDAPMVRLDFANGETRQFFLPGGDILLNLINTPGVISEEDAAKIRFFIKAATHGAEQKLGDEMAYTPKKDEVPPSLADKIEWIDELIARLNSLEWKTEREGGGGLPGGAILLQALCELSGKDKNEMRAFLQPLTKDERAMLKRTSPVKEKIAEIETALAAKNGVTSESVLSKFASFLQAPPAQG